MSEGAVGADTRLPFSAGSIALIWNNNGLIDGGDSSTMRRTNLQVLCWWVIVLALRGLAAGSLQERPAMGNGGFGEIGLFRTNGDESGVMDAVEVSGQKTQ